MNPAAIRRPANPLGGGRSSTFAEVAPVVLAVPAGAEVSAQVDR